MKKIIFMAAALCCSLVVEAQMRPQQPSGPDFKFTTIDSLAITPIKNQGNAGTCWAYSGLAFIESEVLRTQKKAYDLSEMYVAFNTYMERAEKAVRTSGDVSFGQGGDFGDILEVMSRIGMVPDEIMPAGAKYGKNISAHSELSALVDPMVAAAAKLRTMQVSPDGEQLYKKAIRAVHEVYLGSVPSKFTYQGKEYTPQSFAKSLGINAKDYVSLTSFMHHPYSTGENLGVGYAMEAQDNWRWALSYNLELDDFCQIFEDAIKAGYTILWGSDVSEAGFGRQGVGVYNDVAKVESTVSSDQIRLIGADPQRPGAQPKNDEPQPQKVVTPEERQAMYDGKQTTDDHAMQIFGIAKDQFGQKYFMVKNSWGDTSGKYKGIYYVTPEYVRAKTLNILINKNAISSTIKSKYGIK